MPLYEYEHCGERFEGIVPVAARDGVNCPKCGEKAKRLVARNTSFKMNFKPDWAYDWKQGNRF